MLETQRGCGASSRSSPRCWRSSGALTAMCFVKVYGDRVPRAARGTGHRTGGLAARRASRSARAWRGWPLAASCSGCFRCALVRPLSTVCETLIGTRAAPRALGAGWPWLVPLSGEQASYSPVDLLAPSSRPSWRSRSPRCATCITAGCGAAIPGTAVSRARPRACRIRPMPSASRSGTSSPPSFRCTGGCPRPDDPRPRFELEIEDRHWDWVYRPDRACRRRRCPFASDGSQHGRISVYLLYSFVTLLVLLALV